LPYNFVIFRTSEYPTWVITCHFIMLSLGYRWWCLVIFRYIFQYWIKNINLQIPCSRYIFGELNDNNFLVLLFYLFTLILVENYSLR
jgi:hypothetical protein